MSREMYKKIQVSQDGIYKKLQQINKKYGVKEEPRKNVKYYLMKPFAVMSNMSLLAWVVVGVMAAIMMLLN